MTDDLCLGVSYASKFNNISSLAYKRKEVITGVVAGIGTPAVDLCEEIVDIVHRFKTGRDLQRELGEADDARCVHNIVSSVNEKAKRKGRTYEIGCFAICPWELELGMARKDPRSRSRKGPRGRSQRKSEREKR